eukprot:gene35078-47132_t
MFWQRNLAGFAATLPDFETEMCKIFDEKDREAQIERLEKFWLQNLVKRDLDLMKNILTDIESNMKIEDVARKYEMSRKHLNTLFLKHLGKSPGEYQKIYRFRQAISNKSGVRNLTELAYENFFYDQSHLIKDFRALTNNSPRSFFKNVDTEQKNVSSLKIDSLMEEALTKLKVAGAAIAVVKDGKVIHQKGYGVGSIDTKVPVTERTNFQIASNTKAFTTAALSILVDEGKIKWDDKVKEYIPEFKMSGLGLGAGDLTFFPDGSDFTVKDVVHIFQHFKPTSAFRTEYNYDNLLYIVAGEIIARVSNMSYKDFIQKRILQPLQMANSFVGDRPINETMDLATPHSSAT